MTRTNYILHHTQVKSRLDSLIVNQIIRLNSQHLAVKFTFSTPTIREIDCAAVILYC